MAVNQADMKCLVYNTVALQVMQDHVKLRDEQATEYQKKKGTG